MQSAVRIQYFTKDKLNSTKRTRMSICSMKMLLLISTIDSKNFHLDTVIYYITVNFTFSIFFIDVIIKKTIYFTHTFSFVIIPKNARYIFQI